jgi:hypothetical protein
LDLVSIANTSGLDPWTGMALEAWAKPSSVSD